MLTFGVLVFLSALLLWFKLCDILGEMRNLHRSLMDIKHNVHMIEHRTNYWDYMGLPTKEMNVD